MVLVKTFTSDSEQDTINIATELSGWFSDNDVVLLEGNLGSGKTFLVKALCKIWQTTDEASSPTFAILHQYRGPRPVNHFDLYRIEDVAELDNLGWEEVLESGAVSFIEWPQMLEPQLRDYYKIKIHSDGATRTFKLFQNNAR